MNRRSSKKDSYFYQLVWLPLVRLYMFSAALVKYLSDNRVMRSCVTAIFTVFSSMTTVSACYFSHYLFLLLLLSVPFSLAASYLYMMCLYGAEGANADLKQILNDFNDRMWEYENSAAGPGNRYQNLVIENEPDNLSYRIAGYVASLGGGVDSDCINTLNTIIASDNRNKSALYMKCFYEGTDGSYNLQDDLSMFIMKTSDNHALRLKFMDMLVALSFVDNNIQVDKFRFIREVSGKIEVNNKELNRILNTRTNGQYGVRYGIDELTESEREKAETDILYGTVETFALTLMGYVASADRNVSGAEYDVFIAMIEEMQAKLEQNKEDEYVKRFHKGTSPKYNPRHDIQLFRKKYDGQLMKFRELLTLIIKMAYADGDVSSAEYDRIMLIASLLDIREEAVQLILFEQTKGKFGRKPQSKQLSSSFYGNGGE